MFCRKKTYRFAWIEKGFSYIANSVIATAKQGIVQYTTEPWEDCEIIVNGITAFISNHFPDSEIIYDDNTKQYTLKWD